MGGGILVMGQGWCWNGGGGGGWNPFTDYGCCADPEDASIFALENLPF